MKLSVRLALLITALVLLCSAVVTVLSYLGIQERTDERATKSANALVNTVYSMASTSAYVGDRTLAEEVVKGLQHNDVIGCAKIVTLEMTVHSSAECQGESRLVREISSPWDNEEIVGELIVYKSLKHVEQLAKEQFYSELSTLIKVILVVSLLILLIAYQLVTKPISRISSRLGEVNFSDDFHMLDEGERTDEIGNISRRINFMLAMAKKQIYSEQILTRKTEELSNHFRLIFKLSKNNLAVTDESLRVKSFNPRFEDLVLSVQSDARIDNSDQWMRSVTDDPKGLRQLVESMTEMERPTTTEVEVSFDEDVTNIRRFYNLTFVKSVSEELGVTVLFFIYDMTEHHNKLEKTEYEANHDNLTTLYNRGAASKKIRHILTSKQDDQQVAVLFIDLDGFKEINDTRGHDAGDVLLHEMGLRLRRITRKSDVACRWGGDEFLVALTDINLAQAMVSANKILESIVEPIELPDGGQCVVGASIGLTISTREVSDFSSLYDRADKAMYRVKKSGKNAVMVYNV